MDPRLVKIWLESSLYFVGIASIYIIACYDNYSLEYTDWIYSALIIRWLISLANPFGFSDSRVVLATTCLGMICYYFYKERNRKNY